MDRRTFTGAVGASLCLAPLGARPQSIARVHRIGFLGSTSATAFASRVEALRAGLRDLGYVEGRNIVIEFRWADGDVGVLPRLAADLVHLDVDVLVVHSNAGAKVARQATSTIPIVMAVGGDAIATGLVQSLARPGANLTGSTILTPEINTKRITLLKEAVPGVVRVAVLARHGNPDTRPFLRQAEEAARSLAMVLKVYDVRASNAFAAAFTAMAADGMNAVAVNDDPMLITSSRAIADMAAKHRLPSTGSTELAEAGGLMGYGVDVLEVFRRAALFIDKILKGARAGELPVEQATKFQLIVNLHTAKMLGLTVPKPMLFRADKVIQ
jgi:putative ABC transport system substrate-binding protein